MSDPGSPKRILNTLVDPLQQVKRPAEEMTGPYQPKKKQPPDVNIGEHLAPPHAPGELGRLAQYRVLKVLGQGGMGTVLLAEDSILKRLTAVKIILPQYAREAHSRERFLREAQAAAKIRHDNVVTVFQVGEERGIPFIAMEYLKGSSLDSFLAKRGDLAVGQIIRVGRQIAEGLKAAHSQNLTHRDIKPANIWLEAPKGRVKILDFGLASDSSVNVKITHSGLVLGTPLFMSPEQANGQVVDQRSDLFSLGVVFYRLCTGRQPFMAENMLGVFNALAKHTPPPVRRLNPDVPEQLEALIARMLVKDPTKRLRSCDEAIAVLAELQNPAKRNSRTVALAPPPPNGPAPRPIVGELPLAPSAQPNHWADLDPILLEEETVNNLSAISRVLSGIKTVLRKRPAYLISMAAVIVVIVVGVLIASRGKTKTGSMTETELPNATPPANHIPLPNEDNSAGAKKGDDSASEKKSDPVRVVKAEECVFDVGNGVKMTFCWIPPTNGKVTLGSPNGEAERFLNEDEHGVELDGFWMAKTEMTQAQYVNLTGKKNPSYFCAVGDGRAIVQGKNTDDFPVEQVSWNDAQECIKGMKVPQGMKRIALPSEAQWEWACRGGRGNGRPFYFGNVLNGDKANSDGRVPYGTPTNGDYLDRTEKVGSYESKAAHPWGLCDMHGNVWEWCEDYLGAYGQLPGGKNPVQTARQSDDRRVVRGGAWGVVPSICRSAFRGSMPKPDYRGYFNGFRVVILP